MTRRNRKALRLSSQEKKFAAFALMSGTALLSIESAADASIVTGNVNQTMNINASSISIDFDNDSTNELSFGTRSVNGTGGTVDFSLNLTDTAMIASGSSPVGAYNKTVPTVLPGNTVVGSTPAGGGSWSNSLGTANFKTFGTMQVYDATTGLPTSSGWAGASQKFIGLGIVLSSEKAAASPGPYPVHFGWVRVSVPSTSSGLLTVHDWAYESVAGQSIQTPGVSSVPEPGTLQVVALGGLGLAAWRRRRLQAI